MTLLEEIEIFLAETGMSPTYFGEKAMRNWRLVKRLRDGGDITIRNGEKVQAFMRVERDRRQEKADAA